MVAAQIEEFGNSGVFSGSRIEVIERLREALMMMLMMISLCYKETR